MCKDFAKNIFCFLFFLSYVVCAYMLQCYMPVFSFSRGARHVISAGTVFVD